ncbi:MAG: 2-succinyl-6-hydroxy-2,4-cyclohexadiene-1-carboxylate synthase, partial [Ignavibacteriae bacterium]|nr:2-succinyl-6-hydroxy-2,4-cyclohexadiene-1-carboxylate synthase [Ignavibacteriota bacterium]
MMIEIDTLKFFVKRKSSNRATTPIVFLHGFTGSSFDWEFLFNKLPDGFEPIIIDLLGHGKTSTPKNFKNYSVKSQIEFLDKIFKKLNIAKPILVGYSMGGRLALSYLFSYTENVEAVILESTSFGLKTKAERDERIISDEILTNQIRNSSIEKFIESWMKIPLFDSQNKLLQRTRNEQTENKISTNNVVGLTNSLLGFGTGNMNNYFNELEKVNTEILLLTGRLDSKFTEIAIEANSLLPNSHHSIVGDAGHNVHLEKPEEFL